MAKGKRKDNRDTWTYRKMAERVRSKGGLCPCGRPIDPTLPRDHPASASADHVQPVGKGGDVLGPLVNMHRVCNMRRGQQPMTPELRLRLASLPLTWDTPSPGRRAPRHSQEW